MKMVRLILRIHSCPLLKICVVACCVHLIYMCCFNIKRHLIHVSSTYCVWWCSFVSLPSSSCLHSARCFVRPIRYFLYSSVYIQCCFVCRACCRNMLLLHSDVVCIVCFAFFRTSKITFFVSFIYVLFQQKVSSCVDLPYLCWNTRACRVFSISDIL